MAGSPRRLSVRVTPRAKRAGVIVAADGALMVKVTAPAQDGRANAAVIAALAEYFGVAKRSVTIIRGATSRHKIVEMTA